MEIGDNGAYFISMEGKFYSLFYIKTNTLANYPKDKVFVVYIDADGMDYVGDGKLSYEDFEEAFKMYDVYYSYKLSARELYDGFKNKFQYPLEFYERWKVIVEGQLKI
jgi:hypothetical protein